MMPTCVDVHTFESVPGSTLISRVMMSNYLVHCISAKKLHPCRILLGFFCCCCLEMYLVSTGNRIYTGKRYKRFQNLK